jgi:hypothetical protein
MNTELFAREVMPHMRGLWKGFEDKWSPKPMPEPERAMPAPLNFKRVETNGKTTRKAAAPAHESRSAK